MSADHDSDAKTLLAQRPLQKGIITAAANLRSKPKVTKAIYSLCALGILAEPFLWASGAIRMNQVSLVYPYYTFFLWLTIFGITLMHQLDAQWMLQLTPAVNSLTRLYRHAFNIKHNDAPAGSSKEDLQTLKTFAHSLTSNRFIMRVLAFSTGTWLIASLERSIISTYRHPYVLWSLIACIGISLLFPAASIVAISINRNIQRKKALASTAQPATAISRSLNSFLTSRAAYLGAYMGMLSLTISLCFSQLGVGTAYWLYASLTDANLADGTGLSEIYVYLSSAILALVIFIALSPLAIRLSSSFQIFANRVFVAGDSFLDALIDTANMRSRTVHLPEHNLALKNIFGALLWLSICYASLFSLVAFCPDPLGSAILNWLAVSAAHANLNVDPFQHANFRLFLASIVAGYGAVPVAVMGCAFLPPRKEKSLIVSQQGVLSPDKAGNLFGFSPLKTWSNLRSVRLSEPGPSQTLQLKFGRFDSIKLQVAEIDRSELAELLAAADEYAPRCEFGSRTVAFRLQLMQDSKTNTLIESEKFSSTIFSPKISGDFLYDNKYRIVRKLAGKALSTVYLARANDNQERVVIKEYVLPSNALQRERMLETFQREFQILSSLRHPGIAQVKEMFEESHARYLCIEFVDGQDLRSIVQRKGPRSDKTAKRWALEICDIMLFLHLQSPPVIHRDLTPDNLMENDDGIIKLIDFGAAHQFMEGVTGTLIGKQCYIAPEQLRGKPTIKSDIYSFGCTLYFILTAQDPVALRKCVIDQASISESIRSLVSDCTEFDEEKRPESFASIKRRLQGLNDSTDLCIDDALNTCDSGEANQ